MIRSVFAILISEFKIAYRNRWILTAAVLMTLFGLMLAFAGSSPAGTLGVDRLTVTVSSLTTLSVYLIPLLALLLSYDSFSSEAERGTLALLLTYPVSRLEILAGKFLAQLLVLTIAILVGFGITALSIWAVGESSWEGFLQLLKLQWSAVLLGAGFLAVGACLSVSTRHSSTAASLALALWLLVVVMYDVFLLGAVVADDGGYFTKSIFPWLLLANPTDAFRLFNLLGLENSGLGGGISAAAQALALPTYTAVISMVVWVIVCLLLAITILRRRDA